MSRGRKSEINIDLNQLIDDNLKLEDSKLIETNLRNYLESNFKSLKSEEVRTIFTKMDKSLENSLMTINENLDDALIRIKGLTKNPNEEIPVEELENFTLENKTKIVNLYKKFYNVDKNLLEIIKEKIKISENLKEKNKEYEQLESEIKNHINNMTNNIDIQINLNNKLSALDENTRNERENFLVKLKEDLILLKNGEKKTIYEIPNYLKNLTEQLDKKIDSNKNDLKIITENIQTDIMTRIQNDEGKIKQESREIQNNESNNKIENLLTELKKLTKIKEEKEKEYKEIKENYNKMNYEILLKKESFKDDDLKYRNKNIFEILLLFLFLVLLIVFYFIL